MKTKTNVMIKLTRAATKTVFSFAVAMATLILISQVEAKNKCAEATQGLVEQEMDFDQDASGFRVATEAGQIVSFKQGSGAPRVAVKYGTKTHPVSVATNDAYKRGRLPALLSEAASRDPNTAITMRDAIFEGRTLVGATFWSGLKKGEDVPLVSSLKELKRQNGQEVRIVGIRSMRLGRNKFEHLEMSPSLEAIVRLSDGQFRRLPISLNNDHSDLADQFVDNLGRVVRVKLGRSGYAENLTTVE